jgi:hypothetical protein
MQIEPAAGVSPSTSTSATYTCTLCSSMFPVDCAFVDRHNEIDVHGHPFQWGQFYRCPACLGPFDDVDLGVDK